MRCCAYCAVLKLPSLHPNALVLPLVCGGAARSASGCPLDAAAALSRSKAGNETVLRVHQIVVYTPIKRAHSRETHCRSSKDTPQYTLERPPPRRVATTPAARRCPPTMAARHASTSGMTDVNEGLEKGARALLPPTGRLHRDMYSSVDPGSSLMQLITAPRRLASSRRWCVTWTRCASGWS